jgi:hypothetical protein
LAYNAAIDALMRRKLLESIYDRMSDEEKRLFIQLTMQQKSADQIMSALSYQQQQLVDLRKHQQTFAEDFTSNVAGNALWSGALWLISRLAKLV